MWIESHQTLGNHPKRVKLTRLLRADPSYASLPLEIAAAATIGLLHQLWWWALDFAPEGDVTGMLAEEIAAAARWTGDPDLFLAALLECGNPEQGTIGFLERSSAGRLLIHDWYDYAGKLIQRRRQDAERKRLGRQADGDDASSLIEPDVRRTSDGHPPDVAPTAYVTSTSTSTVPHRTVPDQTSAAAAPPEQGFDAMSALLRGMPGWEPSEPFARKVVTSYGTLDLEEEALKMLGWLRANRKRRCSTAFILNWLKKAADEQTRRGNGKDQRHGGTQRPAVRLGDGWDTNTQLRADVGPLAGDSPGDPGGPGGGTHRPGGPAAVAGTDPGGGQAAGASDVLGPGAPGGVRGAARPQR